MKATSSFVHVLQTFTDSDNKMERQSLTLLLGDVSQRLSDDFSANCRILGEVREKAEAHMSLVLAMRMLWSTIPESLFTSPDPNYERLAGIALSNPENAAADAKLIRSLSTVYRRLWHAKRFGRSFLTSLSLGAPIHRALLDEQLGRCALCRYLFGAYDLESVEMGEDEIQPPRQVFEGEIPLEQYRRMPVLDHVIPQFLGGDGPENWQILCGSCNGGKGEGLAWIMRRGLLPPARPSEAFVVTSSLRHAVLANYVSREEIRNLSADKTGEIRLFRRNLGRLPVFDNLEAKPELFC